MKHIITICIVLVLATSLAAMELVGLDTQLLMSRKGSGDLYELALELDREGLEIYYYNELGILAGIRPEHKAAFLNSEISTLRSLTQSERLYLVTRLENIALPQELMIDFDLGTSVVIRSNLDAVGLRSQMAHPFVELELKPLVFAATSSSLGEIMPHTRNTILQMVNAVSQDSIISYIQHLEDFGTRYALAPNRLEVANWIKSKFESFGMTDVVLHPFQWNSTTQYNVVATIPGVANPDEYIIVGGHHDSISNQTPFETAPGADDNASGTVAALEMARVMMQQGYQPKSSIRFITFAAEEFGLWGSKAYANYAEAQDMNVRLMMNHDMLGYSNQNPSVWQVRLMPYTGSMPETDYAAQITSEFTTLHPFYGSQNSSSSDSYPFWQKGYPVVYFFEYVFTPHYHTPQDLVVTINPAYCTEVIKASVATAVGFSQMPVAPANVELADVGSGNELRLTWDELAGFDLAGYNLYIAEEGQAFSAPLLVTTTQYIFSGLTEGTLYNVQISSLDLMGNESYRVSKSGRPLSVPLTPTGFTETPLHQAIQLDWDDNLELDFAGYVLFRSTDPTQLGSPIHTGYLAESLYLDSPLYGSPDYYFYTVVAMDSDHNVSPNSITLSSRPITLDQGILIVDETKNLGGGTMFQITDEDADAFYSSMLPGVNLHHFDTEEQADFMRLADIGIYSAILWHGNDISDMDYPYNVREDLKRYLDAGGNILFTVMQPSLAFELNANYPQSFSGSSFINSYLGIESVNYTNTARFSNAEPLINEIPALQIDENKIPATWNGHIFRVEGFGAADNAVSLYSYGSDYTGQQAQGALNGLTVGVMKQSAAGKAVTLSFPLYYMEEDAARVFVRYVFNHYFGEAVNNHQDTQASPSTISITGAYPNPFRNSVNFEIQSKASTEVLELAIYNIRGQRVRGIFKDVITSSKNSFAWDGKDDRSRACASGIYYIIAEQGKARIQRKIVLIR